MLLGFLYLASSRRLKESRYDKMLDALPPVSSKLPKTQPRDTYVPSKKSSLQPIIDPLVKIIELEI